MRLWRDLSIRSKLLFLLLVSSLLGAGTIMVIGFFTGNEAMTEQVRQRLTAIRSDNTYEIESYFRNLSRELEVLATGKTTKEAMRQFSGAFRKIGASDTINCSRELGQTYEAFVERLSGSMEIRRDVSDFYPKNVAGCYLQTTYISRNPLPADERIAYDGRVEANDPYTVAHRRHHPFYRTIVEAFELYDIFLVDRAGNIVYTAFKELDFGTNLAFGPYRTSGLGDLFRLVEDNNDIPEAQLVDFTFYRPSYGAPASFMGVPIVENGEFLGMLAVQVPVDRVNAIVNYGTRATDTAATSQRWASSGLGETGEVVLISADDNTLRSLPRSYITNRAGFLAAMRANMRASEYEELVEHGPILTVRAAGENVVRGSAGQEGLAVVTGYQGEPVFSSYGPLELPSNVNWVVTAEMTEDEAFAVVATFGRRMVLGICGVAIATTLLALLFVGGFMAPIVRLNEGAQRVKSGDTGARVDVRSHDELGELGEAFNEMVASVDAQKAEIARQAVANESILTAKFPPAVAERFRNGEKAIVEKFDNVTVVFMDMRRTEQLSEFEAKEGLHILNELVHGFNDAAERLGLEVIRPFADGYLAVCDMNSPKLDNTRRSLDMALEAREVVRRVNHKYGLGLAIFAGIEHGSVMAGVIAESTNSYDVWGRAVDLAQRIAAIPDDNLIGVGPAVVQLVGDRYRYAEGPQLLLSTGEHIRVMYLLNAADEAHDERAAEAVAEASLQADDVM